MNPTGVGLGLMISNILAKRLGVRPGDESNVGLKVHSEGVGMGS